jgi:hypothetical protein
MRYRVIWISTATIEMLNKPTIFGPPGRHDADDWRSVSVKLVALSPIA